MLKTSGTFHVPLSIMRPKASVEVIKNRLKKEASPKDDIERAELLEEYRDQVASYKVLKKAELKNVRNFMIKDFYDRAEWNKMIRDFERRKTTNYTM